MMRIAILLCTLTLPVFADGAALKIFPLGNNLLCVRASDVSENFTQQFMAGAPTNALTGLVLDLRLASGTNQTGIADFLTAKKMALVVLTDAQTQGAAATLATQLHATGAVVITCSPNGAVKNGGDISVALDGENEKRFLENPFTNWVANSSGKLAGSNNLMFYVDHTSEAELVRKRVKDGEEDSSNLPRAGLVQPVINDPALARAVDLLKALTVLHRTRG